MRHVLVCRTEPSISFPSLSLQVFFSSRNPMIRWRLPLLHKWLYNNGEWWW
jgi:hypothetical protein